MKKIISLMLVVALVVVMLTGCGAKTPQGNAVSLIDTTAEDIATACDEGMHTTIGAVLLNSVFIICNSDKAMDQWIHDVDWAKKAIVDKGPVELKDRHCLHTDVSMPITLNDVKDGQIGAYSRAQHMYIIDVFVYPDGNYCVLKADRMV